jgi:hypothetical protein
LPDSPARHFASRIKGEEPGEVRVQQAIRSVEAARDLAAALAVPALSPSHSDRQAPSAGFFCVRLNSYALMRHSASGVTGRA